MRIINKLFKLFLSLTLLGLLTVGGVYLYLRADLPSVNTLKDVQLQTPMKIYTSDGLLISQYGEKRRIPLRLEQIPQQLKNAVLATEDSRFYQHPGIDIIGIMRAATNLIITGNRSQGASTITQQVARNFFLTRERTFTRKIKELFLALHIESLLSKDEILALYLNKISLGHRAFGVGAAAQVYYGKDVNQLTLAEMATIAGLPKAPSTMNPISRPKRAKNRRAVVLGRMLTMGHINKTEYNEAKIQPITASKHGADIEAPAPYLASMVNKKMLERYADAYTKGYKVFTTVPAKLQHSAQQAVINNLHKYDERHGYRGPTKYLWTPTPKPEPEYATETPIKTTLDATTVQLNNDLNEQGNSATSTPYIDENALSEKQIHAQLTDINAFGPLVAAVVTQTQARNAQVQLQSGSIVTVDWSNLKWARPFINDSRRGRKPKAVSDIFTVGAQIWLRQLESGQYRLAQIPSPSGALVALNPQNGAIRSIVGGYSYELSQYNRATQAKRQVGSNIKPFIYSAALEHGHTLASLINDAPIHQWDKQLGVAWRPKNSPPVYDGPTRIRVALAKSKNVVSVRLLKGVGLNNTVEHIEKFGIARTELPENDSLALGSASLTPLQVASGIATFANGGYLIEPYVIDKIVDANNTLVYQANPLTVYREHQHGSDHPLEQDQSQVSDEHSSQNRAPQVISQQNAFLISQAMTSTIWGGGDWNHDTGWNGTGWRAQSLKRRDLAGKTGTTNDARDTWFSGFNSQLMVTTWVGFDDPARALGRGTAGSEAGAITAQPAWNEFMLSALKGIDEQPPQIPDDIVSVRIDQKTGLLATKNDHTSRFEYFIRGTEPQKYATDDTIAEVIDNDGEGKVVNEEEIF